MDEDNAKTPFEALGYHGPKRTIEDHALGVCAALKRYYESGEYSSGEESLFKHAEDTIYALLNKIKELKS